MISFDYLVLKAFFEENKNFFKNGRIQKIQSPSRRDLILTLRNTGETRKFYINIDPNLHHLCFLSKENEELRALEIPKNPTMFCMLLRKHLESSKIVQVNVPEYERIFEIFVETYNDIGEKIYLCLAIELMGKYSNIVLYNYDTNVIIGCCHNVGAEKSRNREMAGLLPYVYPPKQYKLNILEYTGEITDLNENFLGFSKAFALQCKNKTLNQLQDYIQLKDISPAISMDFNEFSLFSDLLIKPILTNSVNEMIDEYFAYHQSQNIITNLRRRLNSIINPKYKKISGTIEKLEGQQKKEEKAQLYRLYGELLTANIHQLKDFLPIANVLNWKTNKNISIVLDETKSIKDNANSFFKLYNKAKKSSTKLVELSKKLTEEKKYYGELLYNIEEADSIAVLKEILEEISDKKTSSRQSTLTEELFQDYKIYIGQNNKQNDLIISKLSDKNDLWFHIKDCPGSHILLKNPTKEMPPDEVIIHCAKLAKKYSKARNSSKASVIYTFRKNLKKPPASNLGYVTYKNEWEILID